MASVRPGLPKSRDSLALEMPADITLDSYPGAYGQVLTNLIFNAVTHGFTDGPGGHVLIKARRLGMEQVEITFSDDGSGIPEDVQRHVFDPFFTTRRAQGSTGLGLYIVHNLVTQQLGGRITLVSALGKGTTICMNFPCAPQARLSRPARQAALRHRRWRRPLRVARYEACLSSSVERWRSRTSSATTGAALRASCGIMRWHAHIEELTDVRSAHSDLRRL